MPPSTRPLAPALAPALGLVLVAALGCASTRITDTWRDPALGAVQFDRVAGIALSADSTLRRLAEDEFVRAVGPAVGVAGYTVLEDDELRDRDRARARLEAAGVDGAVVFRLAGVEERQRWVPPTSYHGMWGYWGWAGPMVYEPGYLATDRIVQIETAVYDVRAARLVWAGRSETFNPGDAHRLVDDVVRVSVEALREEKLLPPAPR